MARIMFMANAPWVSTGYGVQGRYLVPRLKALGHELAYFGYYGLEGGVIAFDGYRVYPRGIKTWGEDVLPSHLKNFGADALITLLDVWVFRGMAEMMDGLNCKWFPWLPIDTDPLAPPVYSALNGATAVLPYSRFGERLLLEANVPNVRYVPHGVGDSFRPGDKAEARKRFGFPEDAFIIGMVAANKGFPSRKAIPEQMKAFAKFHVKHPNSIFYIHTLVTREFAGVDIADIARQLGIADCVRWSDQYAYLMGYSEKAMSDLYKAFDVLSSASESEGFGIPILEAQACGTPVVVNNCTSMPELCWSGVIVTKNHATWTPVQSWVYVPDIDAIAEAYEHLYERLQDPVEARILRNDAVAGAEPYYWDRLVETWWEPVLSEFLSPGPVEEA